MVRIYLDLETDRSRDDGAFTNEKIISVGLLLDETPYNQSSLSRSITPQFFTEWDMGSEKSILMALLELLGRTLRGYRFTVVVGFNILRFDIPLIISRATELKISEISTHSKLWYDTCTIDHLQTLLPANHYMFKGLKLDMIVKKAKELGLDPPMPYGSGADIHGWYERGMYDEILGHRTQDLQIVRWLDLLGTDRLIDESGKRGPLFRESQK